MKGFKFEPVKWMTWILGVLTGIVAINETLDQAGVHLIPDRAMAFVSVGIVVITAVLGVLAHNRVTPTADPKTTIDGELVPLKVPASAIPSGASSSIPDPQR